MQFDMARAWKDEEYRQSLSQDERAQVPASPAGEIELSEAELEQINGTGPGAGVSKQESSVSAFGAKNNSYFCNNFSYRPTTNLNLASTNNNGGLLSTVISAASRAISSLSGNTTNRQTTTFDFSCSVSSGLAGGVCIFGGGN